MTLLLLFSESFKHCELEFCLDSLTMAAQSLPVVQLYKPLLDGLHRTFILNKENLLHQLEKGKIYDICTPETYHFFPKALGHFITIVYGPKQSVDDLSKCTFQKEIQKEILVNSPSLKLFYE